MEPAGVARANAVITAAHGRTRDQAEEAMAAVRAALGEAEFEREAALGRALSLDETVELARELARRGEQREVGGSGSRRADSNRLRGP